MKEKTDVEMAFHQSLRVSDGARAFGCVAPTARIARVTVAHAGHILLLRELNRWRDRCEELRPLAVFHLRKWDEAKCKLQMPIAVEGESLSSAQSTQPVGLFQNR